MMSLRWLWCCVGRKVCDAREKVGWKASFAENWFRKENTMSEGLLISLDIEALASALSKHLVVNTHAESGFYSSSNNPLGKEMFNRCAKKKCFDSYRPENGREIFALRSDVDAWIKGQPLQVKPRAEAPADEIDRALDAAMNAGRISVATEATLPRGRR